MEHNHAEGALPGRERRFGRTWDGVLDPAGDIGSLDLADLIDVPATQALMEDFHRLTHIPVSLLDLKGNVLVGVGWQEICLHFHRTHQETLQHCLESDLQLSADVPPGEFKLYQCKNGMWDIATPLMVGGRHVGNLFSGQFFFDDESLDEEHFRERARQYGFDEQEYLAALGAVPRLSRQTVQRGMAFLLRLARMISQLSYGNLKLGRSLAERDALFANMLEGFAYCRMLFENGEPQDFIYLDVNGAFEKLTGLTNVVGKKVSEVIPGIRETSPELFEIYGRVVLSGKPEKFEMYVDTLGIWFSIAVYSPQQDCFIAVFDNINERKRHEREIERLNGLYATLSALNQTILHVKSREELFQEVCRITVKHARFKVVWVGWLDPTTHAVHPVARAGDSKGYLDAIKVYADDRPEGHGPVGTCIREGMPSIFNDFVNDPRAAPWHARALAHGLRAAAALPIHFGGDICGVFIVYASESEIFRDKEVALLEEASAAISMALENLERAAQERRGQREREATLALLRLLNDRNDLHELVQAILAIVQKWTGCEAVGLRLREGDDYPYYVTRGFPQEFVQLENQLCERDLEGQIIRDCLGKPVLECMCGNVLCGRFNPALPVFTPNGSFWSNCTTELLASTSEAERQGRTRNRCNGEGYESVALIPLGHGEQILGLLQVNDHAPGRFTPELIAFLEQLGDQIAVAIAQRQAEAALRESEARYRGLFENSMDGIFLTMTDGRITAANPAACAMLGMSEEEICRAGRDGLVDQSDPNLPRALADRARRGKAVAELIYCRKDGTKFFTETSSVILDGGAKAFVLIRDISERKRAEEERQKLEAQLHQSQKMEAIGQLAGGVAHDFNNLLTIILGYSDILLTEMPPDDPNRDCVADIKDAGDRAASLTRQLLAFSRKQILAPRILSLNDVVREVEKMLRRLIGEDITLTTILSPGVSQVKVDPGQIEQVMLNLAVNARDAMPRGGRLTIETRACELAEDYCRLHPESRPGRYTLLCLTDTGCGMSPEVKSRLFEPFFTTKGPGQGTGLGLATVFGVVKQSEGMIEVYSEEGVGTCFKIYLPAVDDLDAAVLTGIGAGAVPRGSETILLVEDEEGVRRITRRTLEARGYRVLEANSGPQAIRIDQSANMPIELLVTDIVMPEMSGRQLAEILLTRHTGLKVLFMSGYTDDAIVRHGIIEANAAFLQKPFVLQDLARKVRDVLDGNP